MQFRVLSGQVNVYGAVYGETSGWQTIISDPRKNMLLDIKNKSKQGRLVDLLIGQAGHPTSFTVKEVPKNASLIELKEFTDYT